LTPDQVRSLLLAAKPSRYAPLFELTAEALARAIIGSKIGAQPLDKLRPSHIEAWKVQLEHRGLSESTIRSAYTILRAVLDTAVRDRALAQNPAHAVRRPKVPGLLDQVNSWCVPRVATCTTVSVFLRRGALSSGARDNEGSLESG
jgi:hypothetical protein